jgi:hypothetical protein
MKEIAGLFLILAKNLGKNAEASLALGMGVVAWLLLLAGANEWLACGTPTSLYVLFCVGKVLDSWSKRAEAEFVLKRLETENLQKVTAKLQKQKERQHARDIPRIDDKRQRSKQ